MFNLNSSLEKTEEELWAWAMQPENRERICESRRAHPSPEEKMRRFRQIFGMTPDAPWPVANAPEANQGESSPIKPGEADSADPGHPNQST